MFKTAALTALAVLALAGCGKQEPTGRRTGPDDGGRTPGGKTEEKMVVTERTDWSIRYVAREDYVNEDSSIDQVEHFQLSYKGNGYYIVRIIRPDDFREVYESDAAAFFTYESESLLADAKADNVNFWQYTDEVFTSKVTDILFNRLRSGTWTAFLIELNTSGEATGNYAEANFTIREEEATEAFNRWLGSWRASNGLMGYDLTISSLDNNFLYRIDGWEQGQAVSFQMDQEYIEGQFWAPNGFLYIVSQYLGTYDDEDFGHGTVDELFMGNIFDSNGITIITDEGIDIAVMVPQEEGAELQPMEVSISTGSGNFDTHFHSIQYYMWAHSDGNWYPYNANVAELPLTMTRTGTRSADLAPARERPATRASIHHDQPKSGRPARNSVAKKTVRVK